MSIFAVLSVVDWLLLLLTFGEGYILIDF